MLRYKPRWAPRAERKDNLPRGCVYSKESDGILGREQRRVSRTVLISTEASRLHFPGRDHPPRCHLQGSKEVPRMTPQSQPPHHCTSEVYREDFRMSPSPCLRCYGNMPPSSKSPLRSQCTWGSGLLPRSFHPLSTSSVAAGFPVPSLTESHLSSLLFWISCAVFTIPEDQEFPFLVLFSVCINMVNLSLSQSFK